MKRGPTLLLIAAACGRSHFDPPPGVCGGSSSLEVTFDGLASSKPDVSSILQRDLSVLTAPPDTAVWLMVHDPPAGDITLPDPSLRIMYAATVGLDTVTPAAANWYLAAPDGDVVFAQPGNVVGDRRCGWFDIDLRWTPPAEGEHSIGLRGTFDGTVRAPINY